MSEEVTPFEEVVFTPSVMDGQEVNAGIMRKIAEAESVDEVFDSATGETLSLSDIAGEYVTINAVRFHESAEEFKEGGWGLFAVIETDDGRIVTTGSKAVVLKLYKVAQLNGFPLPYQVVFKSRQTRNGYTVWDVDRDRR